MNVDIESYEEEFYDCYECGEVTKHPARQYMEIFDAVMFMCPLCGAFLGEEEIEDEL